MGTIFQRIERMPNNEEGPVLLSLHHPMFFKTKEVLFLFVFNIFRSVFLAKECVC